MAALLLVLTACTSNKAYYHFEHIDTDGWDITDTVTFVIPPQSGGIYNASLCMRVTPSFPYASITLNMITSVNKSKIRAYKRFRCHIYNNVGEMNGKKGISSSEMRFPLHQLKLKDNDSITIRIHHCMKEPSIPGITDLGIELTGVSDSDQHQYARR